MASIASSRWPCSTCSPRLTHRRTTRPGIWARSVDVGRGLVVRRGRLARRAARLVAADSTVTSKRQPSTTTSKRRRPSRGPRPCGGSGGNQLSARAPRMRRPRSAAGWMTSGTAGTRDPLRRTRSRRVSVASRMPARHHASSSAARGGCLSWSRPRVAARFGMRWAASSAARRAAADTSGAGSQVRAIEIGRQAGAVSSRSRLGREASGGTAASSGCRRSASRRVRGAAGRWRAGRSSATTISLATSGS